MSKSTDNLIVKQQPIDEQSREQHRTGKVSESFPHPSGWAVKWEQEGLLRVDHREDEQDTTRTN